MSQETRKGGLGRGLAALIPSGPSEKSPRLGESAADVILGGTKGARGRRDSQEQTSPSPASPIPSVSQPKAETSTGPSPASTQAPPFKVEEAGKASTQTPTPTPTPTPQAASDVEFGATYREIPIGEIVPNPQQPRSVFDAEALDELVHSISEFGLMQPIVVRPAVDDSGYELIMGERRWRAATRAGLTKIPAIVRVTDDGAMLRDALLENIHRVQLNPLEEASAYQQLLEEFGVTQAQLAQRLGRSRPVITNMIRLLALPLPVQRQVAAGGLSAGHARALLGIRLGDETTLSQEKLAEQIIAEGLSVRAAEEAVTLLNHSGKAPEKKPVEPVAQPEVFTRAAGRLTDEWDAKVTVSMGKRKGRMVVEFGDQDDFERILALIERKD
ncbi:ParB/RepB/Spo0J family partition protein [Corynebacterium alimapuense]|uniref:Cell division protein n=1 Tax=Corynebacterium alimapuense TaxID=1576874 RepID=A0A3M8K4H2_9CORY|nr:ParB/RepB/Spo0J family partition protein [Corynebacterium alimapuense]RNE48123.1 cell division protein [Corynebacterium alimapuense]